MLNTPDWTSKWMLPVVVIQRSSPQSNASLIWLPPMGDPNLVIDRRYPIPSSFFSFLFLASIFGTSLPTKLNSHT
jgi:hypothetical protein